MKKLFVGARHALPVQERCALPLLTAALLWAAMVVLAGCGTTGDAGNGAQAPVSGQQTTAAQAPAPVVVEPPAPPTAPKNPFFDGDGGKGTSITILAPEGKGLAKDQAYLPGVVQGEFMANFSTYSAISVFDRVNLDKNYEELLSGYYSEDAKAGSDLGHLAPTDYFMNGSITKTATGYALQLQITRTADKMAAASYSGNCTFAELDNFTGIRRASRELLEKMGVQLSERAKAELGGAATERAIESQTALAKGIAVQKSSGGKTTFESYQYLYEAKAIDPNLTEAVQRLASFQAVMLAPPQITQPVLQAPSTGNIGADARNEIARYKAEREQIIAQQKFYLKQRDDLLEQQKTLLQKQRELITLLKECDDFYTAHPPFEIYYDPGLERYGAVDFQNETLTMRFKVCSVPVADFGAVKSIIQGLEGLKTGFESINRALDSVQREIDKVNRAGTETYAVQPVTGVRPGDKTTGAVWTVLPNWAEGSGRRFDIGAALRNEKGKEIGRTSVMLTNPLIANDVFQPDGTWAYASFSSVKIDDITDTLTTVITSVNGVRADQAGGGGYVKIAARALGDTDYTFGGFNLQGFNAKGFTREEAPFIAAGCTVFTVNGRKMLAAPASTEFKANWNDAVARCKALEVNGVGGWRLPTKDELNAMYQQLKKKGLGGFSNDWYWSSSEYYSGTAWDQYFGNGLQDNYLKSLTYSVRAVRAF